MGTDISHCTASGGSQEIPDSQILTDGISAAFMTDRVKSKSKQQQVRKQGDLQVKYNKINWEKSNVGQHLHIWSLVS